MTFSVSPLKSTSVLYMLTFRQCALNFKARSSFLPSTHQPVLACPFSISPQIKPMTMEKKKKNNKIKKKKKKKKKKKLKCSFL